MNTAMTDIPAVSGPTEKERKYDRQLRLWAASGQAALENGRILLINSGDGTVGVEALKNLVLPGIGHFTIFDEAIVTEADLGVNFFLDSESVGKSRAECCTQHLLELNPDVDGDWLPKYEVVTSPSASSSDSKRLRVSNSPSVSDRLQRKLTESPPFTVILYALPINPELEDLVFAYSSARHIPIISVHSVGFYGYFNIQYSGPRLVVETHPDAIFTNDLRLLTPWPELQEFADLLTTDIESQDHATHGHIPMVALLLHYLKVWKEEHDGRYPLSNPEKNEFRKQLAAAMRTDNPEGGEENFEEAIAAVIRQVVKPSVSSNLREVFEYVESGQVDLNSDPMWIVAQAVKQFYDKNGCLPVSGSIPDMKAESHVYVKLQGIYKSKAQADMENVFEITRNLPGGNSVSLEDVATFCKYASFVKLINHNTQKQSLQELSVEQFANDAMAADGLMPWSLWPVYLAMKTTAHIATCSKEGILATVIDLVPDLAGSPGLERVEQAAEEVARAGGAELHNISAVVGGMIAQEIIKVVTKQYVPIDNLCIYDGIHSRTQVLRL